MFSEPKLCCNPFLYRKSNHSPSQKHGLTVFASSRRWDFCQFVPNMAEPLVHAKHVHVSWWQQPRVGRYPLTTSRGGDIAGTYQEQREPQADIAGDMATLLPFHTGSDIITSPAMCRYANLWANLYGTNLYCTIEFWSNIRVSLHQKWHSCVVRNAGLDLLLLLACPLPANWSDQCSCAPSGAPVGAPVPPAGAWQAYSSLRWLSLICVTLIMPLCFFVSPKSFVALLCGLLWFWP